MEFNQYQKESRQTLRYRGSKMEMLSYMALGITGEAGEMANKIKKILRDHEGKLSPKLRQELKSELGDILWYISQLATELGAGLDEIADENLKKVFSRQSRNKINGNGDNR